MRVAVLTISDSVTKGEREDLSGPAVVAFCRGLGWEVTSSLRVSDDPANIREQLRAVADSGRVDVLLTTGGTGIGPRDNTPEATQATADLINRHPDRFLFGTDEVAPTEQAKYLKVYDMYAPLFARLTPEASEKVRKGNYERLFDQARPRVRQWEKANTQ